MKFEYVGDKDVVSVFGYHFGGGAITDVVEPEYINRLLRNRHFEVVGEEKEAPKKPGRPKKVKEEA